MDARFAPASCDNNASSSRYPMQIFVRYTPEIDRERVKERHIRVKDLVNCVNKMLGGIKSIANKSKFKSFDFLAGIIIYTKL